MIEDRAIRTEKKLLEITERIRWNMDKKKLPCGSFLKGGENPFFY